MSRKTTTCLGCWRYECFSFAGGSILYHYCAKADGWQPCDGKGCEQKETTMSLKVTKISD